MQPDWDQHYQEKHTPWDKGAPAPPLLDWLASHPGEMTGRILVPGCGLGHDVRAIADSHPKAEVVGLDISPTALEQAGEFPVVNQERYREADLFDLPEGMLQAFDWVWEHTCYCAIDPSWRNQFVEAVWIALQPGGRFLGVFYLDPYDDEHHPGEGPPHGCTFAELKERFIGSGRFEIVESFIPENTFEGREQRELIVEMQKID